MTTPDTITTAQVQAIFHALATATEKSRRIMRSVEDGLADPDHASATINAILANLQSKLGRDEP